MIFHQTIMSFALFNAKMAIVTINPFSERRKHHCRTMGHYLVFVALTMKFKPEKYTISELFAGFLAI